VVASIRRRFPGRRLRVDWHTDAKGGDAFNLALSRRRAEAVADWLAGHGIDGTLLSTKGFDETRPVAPNRRPGGADNPDGRQQNRRVVIGVEPG
jgi:OOP family OmpA-OmpF porin